MSEHLHPATQSEEHARTPGVLHESEAFDFRLIIWVGVSLVVIGVVIQVVLGWLLGSFEKYHAAPRGGVSELAKEDAERPLGQRVDNVPAPRLEGIERESRSNSIAGARRRAEEQMGRYGWIDREKGIVHIPIEKAMEQVLRSKELGPTSRERKRPEMTGGKR